jgi:predicted nuclease with TOPRIM domain
VAVWQLGEARSTAGRLAEAQRQLREAVAAESDAGDDAAHERLLSLEEENALLAAGKSDLVDQVAALDGEVQRLADQVAGLKEPLVNVPVVDLWPGDLVLRGEPQGDRVVVVPRQTRTVALILNSNVAADREISGLQILAADGTTVWTSSDEPERDDLGTFTIALPVQELAAGRYTLQLVARSAVETEVIETYEIEIR